jgi:hypothetical protein
LALQERTNLNFDFGRILGIWQTCQEACEVAEEDEMKDERFTFVIQVMNNACPVSVEQGQILEMGPLYYFLIWVCSRPVSVVMIP